MFATAPTITTYLDAVDEVDDVRRSLEGLSKSPTSPSANPST